MRLERFLQRHYPGVSRGSLRRLLDAGRVIVGGAPGSKGHRLRAEDTIELLISTLDERPLPQAELPLEVIAISPALVVLNKPEGPATHPLVPGERDTLANALVAHYPECANASPRAREAGFVHRLDWSTSGVLVAARTRAAYHKLRELFGASQVRKEYLALVYGALNRPQIIDRALEPVPGDRRKMQTCADSTLGQRALSIIEPLAVLAETSLVRVQCSTGRRHQVRVHLAAVGHPLVGDDLYCESIPREKRIVHRGTILHGAVLHASRIDLNGQAYDAPLPATRQLLLQSLGWGG